MSAVAGGRSAQTTWQAIADEAPDVVVVAPCGYHLDGALQQARIVAAHLPGLPVWAIDADGLVVRPGPRLVDGVVALAAIIHPGPAGDPAPDSIALCAGPQGKL